jgi:hypothetical protein
MYGDYRRPRSLHPTEDKGINPRTIITLKNLASLASVRLRAVVMAPTRKTTRYSDVTTIQHTRHLRSYDVRFQDGGIGDLSELGGCVFFRLFLLSFDVCKCIKVVCH